MSEREIGSQDFLSIVFRRWRLLAVVCLVAGLSAGVVNFFFLPRWFRSTAVVMAPQESGSAGGLGMLLSQIPNLPGGLSRLAAGITGMSRSQQDFVVILNSRTVADSLIEKFDLEKRYKSDYRFQARKELASHTSIDYPPEGHVIVSVEAREDSVLARDLALEYFIQLNNILRRTSVESAFNKRKFLEDRIEETRARLVVLEDSLRDFQEDRNIATTIEEPGSPIELITMPVKGSLEMLAMLQAQRESSEIELRVKKTLYRSQHPDITLLQKEIRELDRTIKRIESKIPTVALDFARLYREVKIREELYLLLSAQLEEARIDEANDTPSAVLLDEPVIPEYKDRPKRLLNVLITTLAALVLAVTVVVMLDRRRY